MNLLMLAPDFLPVWGGVGTYIFEIAKNIPRNIEMHIVCQNRLSFGNQRCDPSHIDLPDNVFIHYIGTANDTFAYNLYFQLYCKKNLQSLIRKYNIDLVHSHSSMPDLFINPKNIGVPIVTTIHTTIREQAKTIRTSGIRFDKLERSEKATLLLNILGYSLENRYYVNDRYYITVSDWAKIEILRNAKFEPEHLRVIKNGVDCSLFNPDKKREAYRFFPDLANINKPKILYLSRLTESKGVSFFIKSIPQILKVMDVHFIIAGAGKKIKLNIPRANYSYLGYVPHDICPYLLALSDVFILPSLSENFPMSLLEAMASMCAVIATNVGGIPEIVTHKENGVLIPPKDYTSIANSTLSILNDKYFSNKLQTNARNLVKDNFTWEAAVKQLMEYYNHILYLEAR